MPHNSGTKLSFTKAEVIRLDESIREIMQGNGIKPIAVIDQADGTMKAIRRQASSKQRNKRHRRAVTAMREAGVQTRETLDRAIQAILQPIPSVRRNPSPGVAVDHVARRVSLQVDLEQSMAAVDITTKLNTRTLRPVSGK